MALFFSLYGNEEQEISSAYQGETYIEAYRYCLVIKELKPDAYPFFMGHLLLHMPDPDTLDLTKLSCIEVDGKKRFKEALNLLENSKEKNDLVDEDIAHAKELLNFLEKEEKNYIKKNYGQTSYKQTNSNGGCYIATCVYGSYDCPEVWRLRRYRDYYLKHHWWGRLFIKIYYVISPKLVSMFSNNKRFVKL